MGTENNAYSELVVSFGDDTYAHKDWLSLFLQIIYNVPQIHQILIIILAAISIRQD